MAAPNSDSPLLGKVAFDETLGHYQTFLQHILSQHVSVNSTLVTVDTSQLSPSVLSPQLSLLSLTWCGIEAGVPR